MRQRQLQEGSGGEYGGEYGVGAGVGGTRVEAGVGLEHYGGLPDIRAPREARSELLVAGASAGRVIWIVNAPALYVPK